jgi:hypothetical protein
MPQAPALPINSVSAQGNIPYLIEQLCERFLDTTFPMIKDRVMPYVRAEIQTLNSKGGLEVGEGTKLILGIVGDAIRDYIRESQV